MNIKKAQTSSIPLSGLPQPQYTYGEVCAYSATPSVLIFALNPCVWKFDRGMSNMSLVFQEYRGKDSACS